MPLTKAEANKILLSIDGTSEGEHYRQPAIFIGEEFLTRIHHKEDAVVILTGSVEMRDVMLEAEPKLFYITEHYKPWPMLLARLAVLDRTTLKELIAARMGEIDAKAKKKKKTAPSVKKAVKKKAVKKKAR